MQNGSSFDLFDVQYISDLKQKLISLGALDSTDLEITLIGGALKIYLYALVLMMGNWRLYAVQGSSVEGGKNTIARKIGEFSLDTSDWRHMHHFSEKCFARSREAHLICFYKHCA